MQNGPIAETTQALVDNSSYVIQTVTQIAKQVTPQMVQDGLNTLAESAKETVTTENAQSILSSLLETGSDAFTSVCEAASDNPIAASMTAVVGVGTLVGGYLLRNHLKNKAAATKNASKDEKHTTENDSTQQAANSNSSASSSSPAPGEESRRSPSPRRSSGHQSE